LDFGASASSSKWASKGCFLAGSSFVPHEEVPTFCEAILPTITQDPFQSTAGRVINTPTVDVVRFEVEVVRILYQGYHSPHDGVHHGDGGNIGQVLILYPRVTILWGTSVIIPHRVWEFPFIVKGNFIFRDFDFPCMVPYGNFGFFVSVIGHTEPEAGYCGLSGKNSGKLSIPQFFLARYQNPTTMKNPYQTMEPRLTTNPEQLAVGKLSFDAFSPNAATFLVLRQDTLVYSPDVTHPMIFNVLKAAEDAATAIADLKEKVGAKVYPSLNNDTLAWYKANWEGIMGRLRAKLQAGRIWRGVEVGGQLTDVLSFWSNKADTPTAVGLVKAALQLEGRIAVEYIDSEATEYTSSQGEWASPQSSYPCPSVSIRCSK
jgi:hypothetical protein